MDIVVTIEDIPVMFAAGDRDKPIPEQAPAAFKGLEAKLPSLKGRKFYGAVGLDGQYRACVALNDNDDPESRPHPVWIIPGGRYVRRRILDWENRKETIGEAFDDLAGTSDVDYSRPYIEYYRSQRELLIMMPVK